ncbi:hypothetical protein ILYODFUR_033177, partial [Ilyodon furcidens]
CFACPTGSLNSQQHCAQMAGMIVQSCTTFSPRVWLHLHQSCEKRQKLQQRGWEA